MQRIIGKISFGFSIFLLFHSYNSFEVFAQAHDARALKGLRGIYVVVDKIPSEFQKKIGEEQIKKDIELKLRTAGIKVVSESEGIKCDDIGVLSLNLNILEGSRLVAGLIIFGIRVEVWQYAIILPVQQKMTATTWLKSWVGAVGSSNIFKIRDKIREELDFFITDYLSVNPRQ
jgi:hypothetical protein